MLKVSWSHDKKTLVHLALVGDLEADIVEMEVVDTGVDHHQDLVVDTVEVLALEDLDIEVVHREVREDMMAKLVKEDQRVDIELLVVMIMEVVDIVEVLALEGLDIEVLRVEVMEVIHLVIVDLVATVSQDHLSTVEIQDIMLTHREENNSSCKISHIEESIWLIF
jgi:hypothetical protein